MHRLAPAQWQTLTDMFGLTVFGQASSPDPGSERRPAAIASTALVDIDACRRILDELGPVIGSPSRAITASLLGKRIAFLTTGPSLYALSVFDRALDFRLENCITDYTHFDGAWRSQMPIKDAGASAPPDDRAGWRAHHVQQLFAGNLARLWETFHLASGLAPRILWENTAVRVYSLYERKLGQLDSAQARTRAAEDFAYLVHEAPPAVFGTTFNPLSRYFFPPTPLVQPGETATRAVRFRKTCCLYFKATSPAEFCSTCPLCLPRKQVRKQG